MDIVYFFFNIITRICCLTIYIIITMNEMSNSFVLKSPTHDITPLYVRQRKREKERERKIGREKDIDNVKIKSEKEIVCM